MNGKVIDIETIGYRVLIYQSDKEVWTFKTNGLYFFKDAVQEAEKIDKETGKKNIVCEYEEIVRSVKEFE